MKAIMPSVPPEILEWRKRTGADRRDEMWEGVLHMVPGPNFEHQDFQFRMESFLRQRWAEPRKARVVHELNLASPGGWPKNYRIPDLMLVSPERLGIDRNEYFEGAPSVVVEIVSPGDESEEKLPFYLSLGVPEVWLVDRDTKAPRVLVLTGGEYLEAPPGPHGWVRSAETGVELRRSPGASGKPGKLEMRVGGDDATREEIP